MKISKIDALEVLDSRGNPTVEVLVTTDTGILGKAKVPSGASTGTHEALELRDEDNTRYGGKGVLKVVENVKGELASAVVGLDPANQREVDEKMIALDGTENKSRLGANAILGISLAAARAAALGKGTPLYKHIAELYGNNPEELFLPTPMSNVVNGGAHADSGLDFQEYMVIPNGIDTFARKIRAVAEIYQALRSILKENGHAVAVGDEGGFAPRLASNEEPLAFMMSAIEKAGYKAGAEVSLGLDAAASEFFDTETKKYVLRLDSRELSSQEMAEFYQQLAGKYPIALIEDGMAEDDLDGWKALMAMCGDKVAIMGDDFTVTNKNRLKNAVDAGALNSVLIKLNQIGTLTETFDCLKLAEQHSVRTSVSHRSGETGDDFIGDLAAGVCSTWIKSGAPARSERVEKYNRLLEIEHEEENK